MLMSCVTNTGRANFPFWLTIPINQNTFVTISTRTLTSGTNSTSMGNLMEPIWPMSLSSQAVFKKKSATLYPTAARLEALPTSLLNPVTDLRLLLRAGTVQAILPLTDSFVQDIILDSALLPMLTSLATTSSWWGAGLRSLLTWMSGISNKWGKTDSWVSIMLSSWPLPTTRPWRPEKVPFSGELAIMRLWTSCFPKKKMNFSRRIYSEWFRWETKTNFKWKCFRVGIREYRPMISFD